MTPRALLTMLVMLTATALCRADSHTPGNPQVIGGFDIATARRLVTEYATTGLEGLWTASADGATVAIIPADAPATGTAAAPVAEASLLIVVVDSPAPAIAPGTVLGWARPAAKPGKWDARIYTTHRGGVPDGLRPFTLTLADDNHLTMTSARTGLRVRPRIAIPYLGRWGITERREREADLDGFIRIWPVSATTPPPFPTYL